MDRAERLGSAPGDHSSSADLLLLPLPTEPSLNQRWDDSEAPVQENVSLESNVDDTDLHKLGSQGNDDDDSDDRGASDDPTPLGAEHWRAGDATLLTNSQDDSLIPRSCHRSLVLQMDTVFPETRPRTQCQALGQEEALLDSKADDLDLQRTNRLTACLFSSIALGDLEAVREQLKEIHQRGLELTHPFLREGTTGKTCLMKALLRSQDKSEQQVVAMVRTLLQHAEEHGELAELLNASYTDNVYRGQTALHIAIERGLQDTVHLLVEKGANLRARATGLFFQLNPTREECFYFGEYPLSLAACTHQPDVVKFLLSRPDPYLAEARDSLKNTVLHALVLGASDHPGVADMYELVLELSEARRLRESPASKTHLEKLRNQQGLTPLQLAAKEGQQELFQRILSRERPRGDPLHHLSRRFLEWTYGPVSCSLYDLSEVDTTEAHSALKMVVFNSDLEKAYKLLEVEPLRSLLESKWTSFAAPMFAISTAWYLIYMGLFTAITAHQPGTEGSQASTGPPQRTPWKTTGQVYLFLSAAMLLGKTTLDIIWMWPFQLLPFLLKSYFHVFGTCLLCWRLNYKRPRMKLPLLGVAWMAAMLVCPATSLRNLFQAGLVLCSLALSWLQADNVVVVQGMALVLGWFGLLYYSRGFKFTGIYAVVLQKMILQDLLRFLLVYVVFLLGFASAFSALTSQCLEPGHCPYHSVGSASGALFKLTLGLGDLSGPEHSKFPLFFLLLLITYVILTSVLLLNMLIALMTETVNMASSRNEKIWRVQRAITILDLERCLPEAWRWWLQEGKIHSNLEVGLTPSQERDLRTCLRVNERRRARAAGRNQVMGISEDPRCPHRY